MKWELDDNSRSGFQYLIFGVIVIAVPAMIIAGVDWWQTFQVTTDDRYLHIFRNGYLLGENGPQFSEAHSSRGERIAIAALLAVALGLLCALISLPIRRWVSPWAVGRWSATGWLLFLFFSAVALPPTSAEFENGMLILVNRPTIAGDLALPLGKEERIAVGASSEWTSEPRDDGQGATLLLLTSERTIVIGSTSAKPEEVHAALEFLRFNTLLQ